jgi:hypothetical protein
MQILYRLNNNRGGIGPVEKGGYKELLRKTQKAKRKRDALNPLLAAKMSSSAFLRESLAMARSTEFRIDTLRKKIEAEPGAAPRVRQFLKAAEKFVREGNFSKPTADVRDYGFPAPVDQLAVELSGLGNFSLLEVFALAVKNAVSSYGQGLGMHVESQAYNQQRRAAETELRKLQDRISREWSLEDVHLSKNRETGRIRLTFKVTNGAVEVHPLESAGERLMKWLEAHPEAL